MLVPYKALISGSPRPPRMDAAPGSLLTLDITTGTAGYSEIGLKVGENEPAAGNSLSSLQWRLLQVDFWFDIFIHDILGQPSLGNPNGFLPHTYSEPLERGVRVKCRVRRNNNMIHFQ
jgi:hypothetical protein